MSNSDQSPSDKLTRQAPHVAAAFINAIAEEGTKAEAVKWLQKTWNERCQLERELADMTATRDRTAALLNEAIEENTRLRAMTCTADRYTSSSSEGTINAASDPGRAGSSATRPPEPSGAAPLPSRSHEESRIAALEEAAKVCEQMRPVRAGSHVLQVQRDTLDNAALLIRALRSATKRSGE